MLHCVYTRSRLATLSDSNYISKYYSALRDTISKAGDMSTVALCASESSFLPFLLARLGAKKVWLLIDCKHDILVMFLVIMWCKHKHNATFCWRYNKSRSKVNWDPHVLYQSARFSNKHQISVFLRFLILESIFVRCYSSKLGPYAGNTVTDVNTLRV